jgi:SAM-dependent methyltransferase
MNGESALDGLLNHLRVRWPSALLLLAGVILVLFVIVFASERGTWAMAAAAIAVLILIVYFSTTSLWAAYEQYVQRKTVPAQTIFQMGQIQPTSSFVHVGLGLRQTPVALSRRLTRGHIQAIDVYNPQLVPRRVIARQRRPFPSVSDPRLTWLEGSMDLLPMPDNSVPLVVASYSLVEFWQHGDRERLLREMRRILQPGGHLILAEPARTTTQWLMIGPAAARLPPPAYWRDLLRTAGFVVIREKDVGGYYLCFRAEKPLPGAVQQLTLDLGI